MLAATGRLIIQACEEAGRTLRLLVAALLYIRVIHRSHKQLVRQLDHAGFGSIVVLSLVAGLTGMILAMQMGTELERYGALDSLGAIIGATFCREMGPIWAAIIVLARVGSSMAAELGTMVVNEEVEALKIMSIDPVRYLAMPRIVALIIAMPLLTTMADVVGIAGGAFVSHSLYGLPYDKFILSAQSLLTSTDFFSGLFKSMVFAAIIGAVACDRGLHTKGGAEGVGKATTVSVMLNVLFVLVGDYMLTAIIQFLTRAEII